MSPTVILALFAALVAWLFFRKTAPAAGTSATPKNVTIGNVGNVVNVHAEDLAQWEVWQFVGSTDTGGTLKDSNFKIAGLMIIRGGIFAKQAPTSVRYESNTFGPGNSRLMRQRDFVVTEWVPVLVGNLIGVTGEADAIKAGFTV